MLRRSKNGGNWWEAFDWCGPYISDGKFQSSRPGFTTARSAQEQRCKEHDIAYYHCKSQACFEAADRKFSEDSWGHSLWSSSAALLVKFAGTYFHGEYQEDKKRKAEETPNHPKRLRGPPNLSGSKRPAPVSSFSQSKARRRLDILPPPVPDPQDPTHSKMSVATTGGNNGTQGEVGLKPFGAVANTAPDYFTAKFKWIFQNNLDQYDGSIKRYEFRVNSPYDPSVTLTSNSDKQNACVNGWAIYQQRYKYYRVIGCKAHVSFHFPKGSYVANSATPTEIKIEQQKARDAWTKVCGVNLNPGRIQPHTATTVTDWYQLAQARYADWKMVNGDGSAHFTIEYDPSNWATPVLEQQREQFWTPINQNPALTDSYTAWVQNLPRPNTMADDSVHPTVYGHIIVYHEILVQFREWTDDMVSKSYMNDQKAVVDVALPTPTTTVSSETMQT